MLLQRLKKGLIKPTFFDRPLSAMGQWPYDPGGGGVEFFFHSIFLTGAFLHTHTAGLTSPVISFMIPSIKKKGF